MPDISMCCNCDCPYRDKCYRYRAVPDKYWQSYILFEPEEETMLPCGDWMLVCDHFWEITRGQRIRNTADVDKEIETARKANKNIFECIREATEKERKKNV